MDAFLFCRVLCDFLCMSGRYSDCCAAHFRRVGTYACDRGSGPSDSCGFVFRVYSGSGLRGGASGVASGNEEHVSDDGRAGDSSDPAGRAF